MTSRSIAIAFIAAIGAWAPQRVRPPDAVTCPRNDLTVYTGRVTAWDRKPDATSLTLITDWKTTEHVVVKHPAGADVSASFLMRGKPFAKDDWAVIAPDGKLKDGVRASAWVCRDGRNPIIDWERPSG
jgi:hypothetical protein